MRKVTTKFVAKTLGIVMTLAAVMGVSAPMSVQAASNCLTVSKFETAPVIDGTVTAEEWGEVAFTVKEGEANINLIEDALGLPKDFSADIYMGYDSAHIYIAAVAEYPNHLNEAGKASDLWMGDCLQLQIADAVGGGRNEIGFAHNTKDDANQSYAWQSAGSFNMEAGTDYIVKRDGTTTVYEIALGVEQFSTGITELTDGMTLPFSLCFHVSDGGFIEYCAGIVEAKDINLAGLIGLGTAPAIELPNNRKIVTKFEAAPVIDGTVTAEEWGEVALTVKEGEEYINLIEDALGLPKDFAADIYLGYDSTHVYIAAVAEYPNHLNEAGKASDLWMGDCLQLQIADTVGGGRNEIGFAHNTKDDANQSYAWQSAGSFNMEAGTDYIVKRDGTTTVYEIALGVEQFSTGITELTDGMTLPFSLCFHVSDGGFIEYCSGIAQAKDINLAALIGLGAAPEEPVVEEPVVEEAPVEEPVEEVEETPVEEPVEEVVEESAEEEAPVEEPTEESGNNVGAIIGVVAAVAVIAAGVVVFVKKKKKA